MSARAVASPEGRLERSTSATATVVVAAGTLALAVRPLIVASDDALLAMFHTSYLAIAAAAVALPLHETSAGPRAVIGVTAVGVGALLAAALVTGPAVPRGAGTVALGVSVVAAIAEEAVFRRVAYARLERYGAAMAVGGSALLFALVHLPGYGTTAFPLDLTAGALFGWQRWASGSWTAPAATHVVANILASVR